MELEVPEHIHMSLYERLTHTNSYDSTVLNHFDYMEVHEVNTQYTQVTPIPNGGNNQSHDLGS